MRLFDRNDVDNVIKFKCREELRGVIPEPIPASKSLPNWYKSLEVDPRPGLDKRTVRACMPFLESLKLGWIIPLSADVEYRASEDEDGRLDFNWDVDWTVIGSHSRYQVGGNDFPLPGAVMKFMNDWVIQTPEGYSCLFIDPLNRPESRWQCFSGTVQTDTYMNQVNFPFIWTAPGERGVIEKGTPIMQVIPFERDSLITEGKVETLTEEEELEVEKTNHNIDSHSGTYREEWWDPMETSHNK